MSDGKYVPVPLEEGGSAYEAFFASDLDEKMIKELRLDEVMSFYDTCLNDRITLCKFAKENGVTDSQMRQHILEQVKLINGCRTPIFERRQRVSNYFGVLKTFLLSTGRMTRGGKLREIGYDIPDDIFDDLYHLLADAISCRFQLSQYDGKFRDGMFHVLQWLDGQFWANNYRKQYPDATDDEIFNLNRTKVLDLITGRGNANLEVYGETYRCAAFLDDDSLFRLHIDEVVPWNISNAPKEEFRFDKRKHFMWSVDDSFKVSLDATQMAYYVFIYGNPDMTIREMVQKCKGTKEHPGLREYLQECCSSSGKLLGLADKWCQATNELTRNKIENDFEKELKKRESEINKKVTQILGQAYSIMQDDVRYYVPISKGMLEPIEH